MGSKWLLNPTKCVVSDLWTFIDVFLPGCLCGVLPKCQWRNWEYIASHCVIWASLLLQWQSEAFYLPTSLSYILSPFTTQVYLLSDKGSMWLDQAQRNCPESATERLCASRPAHPIYGTAQNMTGGALSGHT